MRRARASACARARLECACVGGCNGCICEASIIHAVAGVPTALVLGACDQSSHIQAVQLAICQRLRHISRQNTLGEPLHDGSLADARLSDQDWIILGAAREHLDQPPYFALPADDRIKPARPDRLKRRAKRA